MTETLIISLVLTVDDGQLQGEVQVQTGGVIAPVMGVNACRAATEYYRNLMVEAEVQRRVEKAQRATEESDQVE